MSDVGHSRRVPPDRVYLDWGMSAVSLAEARVAGEEGCSLGAYTDYVGEDTEGNLALPGSKSRTADSKAGTLASGMGRPWDCRDRSDPPPHRVDINHGRAAVHSVHWVA